MTVSDPQTTLEFIFSIHQYQDSILFLFSVTTILEKKDSRDLWTEDAGFLSVLEVKMEQSFITLIFLILFSFFRSYVLLSLHGLIIRLNRVNSIYITLVFGLHEYLIIMIRLLFTNVQCSQRHCIQLIQFVQSQTSSSINLVTRNSSPLYLPVKHTGLC